MEIENVIGKQVMLDPLVGGFRACYPFHVDTKCIFIVIPGIDYYEYLVCGKQGNTGDFIIEMKDQSKCRKPCAMLTDEALFMFWNLKAVVITLVLPSGSGEASKALCQKEKSYLE